ncbi:MAG TPA: caspase family protein [Pyrinomonadaceae bacterium]|nr:caspase family protein [Pyrinomonadaceae bacterium]
MRVSRLAIALLMLAAGSLVVAQSPAPTPQDKRGLGIESGAATRTQTDQSKSKEAKPELVLQTGYNNFFGATRLVFSPDGRLLATGTFRSSTIKLWETATGRELRNLSAGGQNTNGLSPVVAFSADGRLLAAATGNNSVKVWDAISGRELQMLAGGGQPSFMSALGFSFIAFSADGKKLVAVSDAIRVWDTTNWQEIKTVDTTGINAEAFAKGGSGLALSRDGSQLARAEANGSKTEIKFLDLNAGREIRSVELPHDQVDSLEVSFKVDGSVVAAGIVDKKLKIWDVTTKASERDLAPTLKDYSLIKFSNDGRLMALSEEYKIKLWETATGRELPALNIPNNGVFKDNGGCFVAFSEDGKKTATGGFGTPTLLWETETGKQLMQMKGRSNMAYSVAFSTDGNQLSAGGRTRWDLRTGRGLRLTPAPSEKQLAWPSPDGKLIALFGPNNSTITVLETPSGRQLQTFTRTSTNDGVSRVRFSPDGRLLAATYMETPDRQRPGTMPSLQSQVKIWEVATGRELQTLTPSSSANEIGFSSDSRVLATIASGEVALWDLASGTRLRDLTASPMSKMGNLSTLPNPGSIPNVGRGGKPGSMPNIANMPNMADMTAMVNDMLGTMAAGTMGRSVTSVAFTPDGHMLATGGVESKSNLDLAGMMNPANQKSSKNKKQQNPEDFLKDLKVEANGQVLFWDSATGQQLGAIKGHGKGVTTVVFSRDGKLLASSATDNTIKIWDVASKRELRTLSGHTANIESMDFSPDGRLLASASDEGSTFLWDTNTGEHLLTLISLDDGEWMVVTPEGLFDGTPASWNQILWRYNQDTFNVAPIEWFFNEYYYPGLLADVFAGKRPRVAQDVSRKDRRQPIVKLSLPGEAAPAGGFAARTIKIKIDITDAAADKDHPQGSGARDLRLFRNGSLVKVWHGDALKGQAATGLEEEITVVAGPNRLTAYAFNQDNVKSKDANLLVTGADSLKRAGTAWVIAVGVNEYANSQYNLKYAVADAQSFAEELRRQQTQVARFDHVEVIALLNENATKANFLSALRRLAGASEAPTLKAGLMDRIKRAEPEDAVIIYFAGHGTAQGQRFYLLPHDLGYTGERGALDESGLKTILSHSISDLELEDAVEGLAAGSLLMVIDACNSGQALEAEEKRRGPMNSKGLAQLAYEKGMYILTAAQSYQAALEAAQLGHGLLTYALVEEGLKTAAADNEPKDGILSAREWLDFATERVPLMQEEKMKQGRGLGVDVAFTEGEQKIADPEKRSVQRPRVFYRREMETDPLVIAKPGATSKP